MRTDNQTFTIEEIGRLLGLVRGELHELDPHDNKHDDPMVKATTDLQTKLLYEYNTASL